MKAFAIKDSRRYFVFSHCIALIIGLMCIIMLNNAKACTIVAVSGNVTIDGRPLLLKNRDSRMGSLCITINKGQSHTYLCQYSINYGYALTGYNEAGLPSLIQTPLTCLTVLMLGMHISCSWRLENVQQWQILSI